MKKYCLLIFFWCDNTTCLLGNSVPNDDCVNAEVIFGDGVLDCGEFEFLVFDICATPDAEATGNCMSTSDPGSWYTFYVPDPMPYSAFTVNPIGAVFELFSTSSDCSSLVYEECDGYLFFACTPGTQYYILSGSDLLINTLNTVWTNSCPGPIGDMDTGNGTGGSDLGLNSCAIPSSLMPCEEDHVVWYSYTVGCSTATLDIEVVTWDVAGAAGAIIEAGIAAYLDDCTTLLSAYDPNGNGYVCSAIGSSEVLQLENLPAGTTIHIGVGSDGNNTGYYEILISETGGSVLINDECHSAIPMSAGVNNDLSNFCATADVNFPSCSSQSEATVWFSYDPTPENEDLTIDIFGGTLGNPAIAIYDVCSGELLAEVCGTNLDLECVSEEILIQVGSSVLDAGEFMLAITATIASAPPLPDVMVSPICSGFSSNLELTIPSGEIGTITITVANSSSSDITGIEDNVFSDINSVIIDDILINCSDVAEEAVYQITTEVPGYSCPAVFFLQPVIVFPKFDAVDVEEEHCLPHILELEATSIITGGEGPYVSYSWKWNDSDEIATSNMLSYDLFESGSVTLTVEDKEGCIFSTDMEVKVFPELDPVIMMPTIEICEGAGKLDFGLSLASTQLADYADWFIYDALGNEVGLGDDGLDFYETDLDAPAGTYSIQVQVENLFGCKGLSELEYFTIYPKPNGILEELANSNCGKSLLINFYGPAGEDLYGNGADTNMDGIPDILDTDNDGSLDIDEVIWKLPDGSAVSSQSLIYVPLEEGLYSADIYMESGCIINIAALSISLASGVQPVQVGLDQYCAGDSILLSITPPTYLSYEWQLNDSLLLANSTPELWVSALDSIIGYSVNVVDGLGCSFTLIDTINVHPVPVFNMLGSTSLCPGEDTQLTVVSDSLNLNIEWVSVEDNLIEGIGYSHTISKAGSYKVYAYNSYGCSDSIAFEIIEDGSLSIEIAGSDFCEGSLAILNAGSGFDNYEWTNLIGDVVGTASTLEVSVGGIYEVEVALGLCSGSDVISVEEIAAPFVDIIPTISVCNNDMGSGTLLDFTSLAMSSDMGTWSSLDLPQSILADLSKVNFEGVAENFYSFVYESQTAIFPCAELRETLVVEVVFCPCLSPNIDNAISLCNTFLDFDLDRQLLLTTDAGNWVFISGNENVSIDTDNIIQIGGIAEGVYSFEYVLDETQAAACPASDTLELIINNPPEILSSPGPFSVCNLATSVASPILDLESVIINNVLGEWLDPLIPGLDPSSMTEWDFTGVDVGSYELVYRTISAPFPCDNVEQKITVEVLDCSCPILDIQPAPDFCNDQLLVLLDDYLGLSDVGTWSTDPNNPEHLLITNSTVDLTDKVAGMYAFVYTLNDPLGCPDMDTLSFFLNEAIIVPSSKDTMVCNQNIGGQGTMLNLDALVEFSSVNWEDPIIAGLDFSDPSQLDFEDIIEGTYLLSYRTNAAMLPCENVTGAVQITVIDCSCPVIALRQLTDLCNSAATLELATFAGTEAGGWQNGIANPSEINNLETIIDLAEAPGGLYTFTYTLDNPIQGCPVSDSVSFTLYESPEILSIRDTVVCNQEFNGQSTLIDLTKLVEGSPGIWMNAFGSEVTNPTRVDFVGLPVGETYTFRYETRTAAGPCIDTIGELMITVQDCSCDNPEFLDPPELCTNESEVLDLQDLLISDHQGTWSIIDQPQNGSLSLVGSSFDSDQIEAGLYVVQFTLDELAHAGCEIEWVMELAVLNSLSAVVMEDDQVCVSAEGGMATSYVLSDAVISGSQEGYWENENGERIDGEVPLDFLGLETGIFNYTYVIENTEPCMDKSYEFSLMALTCREPIVETIDTSIYIPNTFAPGRSGPDDMFYVQSSEVLRINKFDIYDRWGELVFSTKDIETNDPSVGWDGTFNGLPTEQGVYVYFLEVEFGELDARIFVDDLTLFK